MKNLFFENEILRIKLIIRLIQRFKLTVREVVKKIKDDYDLSEDEFLKQSALEFLLKRKREIETDILTILDKNRVSTFEELELLIKKDKEHPEWENLISLENLYERLKEIQNDIKSLS